MAASDHRQTTLKRVERMRQAEVLRLFGLCLSAVVIAERLHVNRKTIGRWRQYDPDFDKACLRVSELAKAAKAGERGARLEIDKIVAAWVPPPEPVPARVEPELVELDEELPAEPDVLDRDGNVLVSQPPAGHSRIPDGAYTSKRPPTPAEWLAELAEMAKDGNQPERLRAVAITCVASALFGGGGYVRQVRQAESAPSPAAEAAAAEARERGRDAGVPASVWQEARQNFLGPAPAPRERSSDKVELDQDDSAAQTIVSR